jgi:hypothetical protein
MLCFYESCSIDTLQNALQTLAKWGVVEIKKETKKSKKDGKLVFSFTNIVRLVPPYQEDEKLQNLVNHIGQLRKPPPIRKNATRRAMIADIPILAKL